MPAHVEGSLTLHNFSIVRAGLNALLTIDALSLICNRIKESFRCSLHSYAVDWTYLYTSLTACALTWFTYLHNISVFQYFLYDCSDLIIGIAAVPQNYTIIHMFCHTYGSDCIPCNYKIILIMSLFVSP